MTDWHMRIGKPTEELKRFHAHKGKCLHCTDGIVKMSRAMTPPYQLLPDKCFCLQCGQHYYVKIKGTLEDFDKRQWLEKDGLPP